ncbi:MAG TPA: ribosome silencing factor [Actinobacteria bacterium]|nr:ribosome silencing factor [Actinomycetota bacterium]
MAKTILQSEVKIRHKEEIKVLDSSLTRDLKLNKENTTDIVRFVARLADFKGADYVNILEMKSRLIITDFFIIIGAKNTRLTASLEDEIKVNLKPLGLLPLHTSGTVDANWILIDFDDFVIHIFTEEFRQFYDLERLWKDSETVEWKQQ